MKTDLDSKIRDILTEEGVGPPYYSPLSQQEVIEKIKQALTKAGYVKTLNPDGTVFIKDDKVHVYRSGQEWYDRFEKELYKPDAQVMPINRDDDGESHDRFFRASGANFMYGRALEAAKRAAGLTDG